MADPLSLSASIIAVLQMTATVVQYLNDVKSASEDRQRILDEVVSACGLLHLLKDRAEQGQAGRMQYTTLKSLNVPKGPLEQLKSALEQLESKLSPTQGLKKVRKTFTWPFQKEEVRAILSTIERQKTLFGLALQNDHIGLSQAIDIDILLVRDDVSEVKSGLSEVNKGVTELVLGQRDEQQCRIHRWLAAPDPSTNYKSAYKKRQSGTGSWFVGSKQFSDWKTISGGFLWLWGIPGCGKSILSSTIIEHLANHCDAEPTIEVVYFYFDFNDAEKQKPENMIRSLTTQLFSKHEATPDSLHSLFSSCKNGKEQPEIDALVLNLKQMIEEFNRIYVVLDALDECTDRLDLMEIIEEIVGWKCGNLHIIATSRREQDIKESLDLLIPEQNQVCIQSTLVHDDIRAYIHGRLQTDRGLRRWRNAPEIQQEIEETLMDKVDGMFRWAVCQLDVLQKCLTPHAVRKALASLPKDLDDTYARIICNIDEEHKENALKILQWLAYSFRPLQIEEVIDVIAVDIKENPQFDPSRRLPEPEDILTICSSLVTIAYKNPESWVTKDSSDEEQNYSDYGVLENSDVEEVNGMNDEATEDDRDEERNHSDEETIFSDDQMIPPDELFSPGNRKIWYMSDEMTEVRLAHFSVKEYLVSERIQIGPAADKSLQRSSAHSCIAEICLAYLLHFDRPISRRAKALQLRNKYPLLVYVAEWWTSHADEAETDTPVLDQLCMDLLMPKTYAYRNWIRLHDEDKEREEFEPLPSPLYYMSLAGLDRTVRLLLDKGVEVNTQGGYYGNALQAASVNGHEKIVQMLLDYGADMNVQGGLYGNALQAASSNGQGKVMQILLNNEAQINAQGGFYGNALQAASFHGHEKIVQMLLDYGADMNVQGGFYGNALQVASSNGHEKVVQILLKNGAQINAQGGHYGNALQAASSDGHEPVVRLLLDAGAEVNAQGGEYGNALQAASSNGHEPVVRLLLDAGADVNAEGGYYDNALVAAMHKEDKDIVQLLLDHGAVLPEEEEEVEEEEEEEEEEGKRRGNLLVNDAAVLQGPGVEEMEEEREEEEEQKRGSSLANDAPLHLEAEAKEDEKLVAQES